MQPAPRLPERYQPLERLGESLWLVTDTRMEGLAVVLREMKGWTAGEARREFDLARCLRHPGLVEILSFDTMPETGAPCYTSEYVELTYPDGPEGFAGWASEALQTLAFLHAAGVTHRRIEPRCIRTRAGNHVAVLNHGLALRRDPTPEPGPYVAPEILDGGMPNASSDLYALGAVLFEAVHGRPPYAAPGDDAQAFAARVRSGRRARPALPAGYPAGLHGWLEALLSPDPAARPNSAKTALILFGKVYGTTFSIDAGEIPTAAGDADIERLRGTPEEQQEPIDRQLVAVYGMIRRLNSQNDPESVLQSILDMALTVVRAERGMILLREDESNEFSVRLARNLEHETIGDAGAFSRGIVAQAGAGQSVLSLDARNDERFRELKSVSLYGIHALMCVPLRVRESIIGAVYVDSKEDGLFTPDDLRFLEAFADHAALALVNARRRVKLVEDTERLQAEAADRAGRGNLIGGSPQMTRVFELIDKVCASELAVLIEGESGTGKELVAQAIHYGGVRANRAFVSENCAAIPDTLLQSELFGHVRGAFTGADRDRAGLFEQAHGGTLFLDEVGDMSATMQAQLLRALQQGEIRRVGGTRSIKVDCRIIAATNRDLQRETDAGRFREDLLYRLQVLLIALPPLREREGDVTRLVRHFLTRIAAERGKPAQTVDPDLLRRLERCPWPGNVRQLENTLQRLALLAGEGPLGLYLLALDPGLRQLLDDGEDVPAAAGAALSLASSERERIVEALRVSGGNRARAARLLGVSRATIYRKIKELEL